jgi:glycosyltransferase involved in cell wall biosynthesis
MKEKKKILIFSLAYEPYIGGAEIAIKEITDRLGDEFEFNLITSKGLRMYRREQELNDLEVIGNVKVSRVGLGHWFDQYKYIQGAVAKAKKLQEQNNFDLIWGVLESQAGIAAAQFKLHYPQIPYVLTLQSGDSQKFWFWRTFFWKKIYKQVYKRADHVHAISNFLGTKARKMGAKQVSIIPNGVDIKKFTFRLRSGQEVNEIRNIYNIRESEKIIITTSRLVFKNGVDILIEAFTELAHQRDDVKLLIVGTGPLEHELKKQAGRRGVGGKVVITGHIEHERLPEYLAASDIFVRTPRSEGLGNSFLEAMAVGVPVVATNVGGITDFLEQGVTGLLSNSLEPSDVATKMELLLGDEALQQKIAKNASKLIKENYGWDNIAREVGDIFSNLINKETLSQQS